MLIISTLSNSASAQLVTSICFKNADTKINEIDCDITNAYILLCSYIEDYNICASISLETFIYEYEIGNYSSVTEYLETYYSHFQQSTNRDASAWYYNTGIYPMATPNYNTYNLMAMVQPGATKYYVYRSTTTSGTFPKVAEEVKTRHNSTGLSALTNYYYKIRAYNEDLNKTSKLSDYMGAKTKGA